MAQVKDIPWAVYDKDFVAISASTFCKCWHLIAFSIHLSLDSHKLKVCKLWLGWSVAREARLAVTSSFFICDHTGNCVRIF